MSRIIPYKGAGLRVNHVLKDIAAEGKKDPKYRACIEDIRKGKTPKELETEKPDNSFLEMT